MIMKTMNQTAFYRYDADSNSFAGFGLQECDYEVTKIHSQFEPVSSTWKPIILDEFDDSPTKLGDFPSLADRNCIPLFSEKAWSVFSKHLSGVAEALPLTTTSGIRLLLINVYKAVDAIIEENCSFDRYSDGGIRRIKEFCFDWTKLDTSMIIKLPAKLGGDLLVSHRFREIAIENELHGLNFVEVSQID
jgi:hypothetical protein